MSEKSPDQEWALPVVDSDTSAKTAIPDIGSTGAWAAYAIGAVTKNLLKDTDNKKFPLIEEDQHPAQLTLKSDESEQDD